MSADGMRTTVLKTENHALKELIKKYERERLQIFSLLLGRMNRGELAEFKKYDPCLAEFIKESL